MTNIQLAGTTLLTIAEAASFLDVTPHTLRAWHRLRKGPPRLKIGRAAYYRKEAIEQWVLAAESPSAAATGC